MEVTVTGAGAAVVLLLAFVSDLRTMRIPNLLTVPAFAAGCLVQLIVNGWSGGTVALVGALAGFVPLFLLHLLKGIGAGDVKLFTALGAWTGSVFVLETLMYAIIYAGAFGLLLLICLQPFSRRVVTGTAMLLIPGLSGKLTVLRTVSGKGLRFPFMVAAVPGALTAWYLSAGG